MDACRPRPISNGMKKKTRRLFFYALILIFLLATPLVLAYSFGYTFDFTKGAVEQTGGIFVKSSTGGLSIFLDGTFVKTTSFFPGGALLSEINPGLHTVRLEKAGTIPWSKTIRVEPALVTEFRYVILIPNPVPIVTTTAAAVPVPDVSTTVKNTYRLDAKNNLTEKSGTTTQKFATNVLAFGTINGTIYFVDKNGFLARIRPNTLDIDTIGHPGFFTSGNTFLFTPSPRGDIAVIDPAGGLFLFDGDHTIRPVDGGVKKISFDSRGRKALLLKDHELAVLWLEDNQYQPFQKMNTQQKLVTTRTRLQDAAWLYEDNAHAIYRTDDGIFFTEIDGRGQYNITELIAGPTDQLLTSLDVPNSIFFHRAKKWFRIDL